MSLRFWSLQGLVSYEQARLLQTEMVELRYQDLIPDTVLFLEHHPVVTRGRGLQFTGVPRPKHMPLPQVLPEGVSFSESERGGDLTYHGPGQLVIYPICKLDGQGFAPHHDINGFIRKFEKVLIDELVAQRLDAQTKAHATGVWIGDKKIASLGIAIRKWVTYHGMAINGINDLKPFFLISPCGFQPEVMTRLSDWIPQRPDWREKLEAALSKRMDPNGDIQHFSLEQAIALLRS
jgi:lipoate-protein ligase B